MKRAVIAVVLGALAAGAYACSSATNTQCDCIDPSLVVKVPAESASGVVDVKVSGAACDGVAVTCAQLGIGGCASWRFAASAAGTCHIDVLFAAGTTTSHDITIKQVDGCCAGFYADPVSAAEVDVTPPANGVDAGSDAGDEDAGEDAGNSGEDASDAPLDG